ncbi:MAG: GNAT family protein [Saprospiraceae bacterium]
MHEIKTDRLLLRPIVATDLDKVFEGLSHPDIIRHYGVNYTSREETRRQMEWFAGLEREETGRWWAVCSSDNTVFYGAGGLNGLDKTHQKAEIGFWLLPAFWGQGIMREAMPLICQYAFEKMNIHRIEGFVESENTNCKNAMSKLDFQHEGTLRDCEIKNGAFISLDVYALLRKGG